MNSCYYFSFVIIFIGKHMLLISNIPQNFSSFPWKKLAKFKNIDSTRGFATAKQVSMKYGSKTFCLERMSVFWIKKPMLFTFSKERNSSLFAGNKSEYLDTFRDPGKFQEIKLITLRLASPETIRRWAETRLPTGKVVGLVHNANTLHHNTLKPLKGGLFCERIFGPTKDFQCACGIQKEKNFSRITNTRFFCLKCDVEYTWSLKRRYQLGYIRLVSPVAHLWYVKETPSFIAVLLDMKRKTLDSVIYCSSTLTINSSIYQSQFYPAKKMADLWYFYLGNREYFQGREATSKIEVGKGQSPFPTSIGSEIGTISEVDNDIFNTDIYQNFFWLNNKRENIFFEKVVSFLKEQKELVNRSKLGPNSNLKLQKIVSAKSLASFLLVKKRKLNFNKIQKNSEILVLSSNLFARLKIGISCRSGKYAARKKKEIFHISQKKIQKFKNPFKKSAVFLNDFATESIFLTRSNNSFDIAPTLPNYKYCVEYLGKDKRGYHPLVDPSNFTFVLNWSNFWTIAYKIANKQIGVRWRLEDIHIRQLTKKLLLYSQPLRQKEFLLLFYAKKTSKLFKNSTKFFYSFKTLFVKAKFTDRQQSKKKQPGVNNEFQRKIAALFFFSIGKKFPMVGLFRNKLQQSAYPFNDLGNQKYFPAEFATDLCNQGGKGQSPFSFSHFEQIKNAENRTLRSTSKSERFETQFNFDKFVLKTNRLHFSLTTFPVFLNMLMYLFQSRGEHLSKHGTEIRKETILLYILIRKLKSILKYWSLFKNFIIFQNLLLKNNYCLQKQLGNLTEQKVSFKNVIKNSAQSFSKFFLFFVSTNRNTLCWQSEGRGSGTSHPSSFQSRDQIVPAEKIGSVEKSGGEKGQSPFSDTATVFLAKLKKKEIGDFRGRSRRPWKYGIFPRQKSKIFFEDLCKPFCYRRIPEVDFWCFCRRDNESTVRKLKITSKSFFQHRKISQAYLSFGAETKCLNWSLLTDLVNPSDLQAEISDLRTDLQRSYKNFEKFCFWSNQQQFVFSQIVQSWEKQWGKEISVPYFSDPNRSSQDPENFEKNDLGPFYFSQSLLAKNTFNFFRNKSLVLEKSFLLFNYFTKISPSNKYVFLKSSFKPFVGFCLGNMEYFRGRSVRKRTKSFSSKKEAKLLFTRWERKRTKSFFSSGFCNRADASSIRLRKNQFKKYFFQREFAFSLCVKIFQQLKVYKHNSTKISSITKTVASQFRKLEESHFEPTQRKLLLIQKSQSAALWILNSNKTVKNIDEIIVLDSNIQSNTLLNYSTRYFLGNIKSFNDLDFQTEVNISEKNIFLNSLADNLTLLVSKLNNTLVQILLENKFFSVMTLTHTINNMKIFNKSFYSKWFFWDWKKEFNYTSISEIFYISAFLITSVSTVQNIFGSSKFVKNDFTNSQAKHEHSLFDIFSNQVVKLNLTKNWNYFSPNGVFKKGEKRTLHSKRLVLPVFEKMTFLSEHFSFHFYLGFFKKLINFEKLNISLKLFNKFFLLKTHFSYLKKIKSLYIENYKNLTICLKTLSLVQDTKNYVDKVIYFPFMKTGYVKFFSPLYFGNRSFFSNQPTKYSFLKRQILVNKQLVYQLVYKLKISRENPLILHRHFLKLNQKNKNYKFSFYDFVKVEKIGNVFEAQKTQPRIYIRFPKSNTNLLNLRKQYASLRSAPRLYNNIYVLSNRYFWDLDDDLQTFLYYFNEPTSPLDVCIPTYSERLLKSNLFREPPPVLGGGLIQKFLGEFHPTECSKILMVLEKSLKIVNILLKSCDDFLEARTLRLKRNYILRRLKYIRSGSYKFTDDFLRLSFNKQSSTSPNRSDFAPNLVPIIPASENEVANKVKSSNQTFSIKTSPSNRTFKLKNLRSFLKESRPEWMVLSLLPVLPPDLRPILQIGNQVAASDLNRLYQKVIYRNERLKRFLKDSTSTNSPQIKFAYRLLQEAVDNLIDNGKGKGSAETDNRGLPLKSLTELLKGKKGRFRQNLLGKRVDYSGRSVIVVGPRLRLHECGLPKEMAIELFLPFLIQKIFQSGKAATILGAKLLLKTDPTQTWEFLTMVMRENPVLLNRAPTLHRFGFQAFQPRLVEGKAILLHPLVCPAFNADFDGDQMAVHVPITAEAKVEAWKLMLARNHLLSASTGEGMLLPSQDMVLGCYYLTATNPKLYKKNSFLQQYNYVFTSIEEVLQAYESQKINLHSFIWLRWNGKFQTNLNNEKLIELQISLKGQIAKIFQTYVIYTDPSAVVQSRFIKTTPGRVLFYNFIFNDLRN
uniref:DNA-directed RNA polymerase subunit beta' n=1 Tax=Chaetophoropsis polyrhiza TaxID=2079440 RepID=A0A6H1U5R4_9CHLO|nr:RNA polymerase beta' subunit [Chaetophoropsis polyrhiza]QIZ74222.1 RNA polymerase beta' subunit [Chaetophoropsis polyrhiza]